MGFGKREQIIQAGDVVQIFDPRATRGSVGVIVEIRSCGVGIVHFPIINYQHGLSLDQQIYQMQMATMTASDNVDEVSARLGHLDSLSLKDIMTRSGLGASVTEVLGWISASPTAVISLLVDPD